MRPRFVLSYFLCGLFVEFNADRKRPIVRDMELNLSRMTLEYLGFAGSVLSASPFEP